MMQCICLNRLMCHEATPSNGVNRRTITRAVTLVLMALYSLLTVSPHSVALAQQIGVGVPFNSFSESFYQRMGVGFGFSFAGGGRSGGSRVVGLLPNGQLNPTGNLVFSQGSFGSAIPGFGGYDPGSGAQFGFSRMGRGGGFSLGFDFAQGSSRTVTSSSPFIMVPNGGGGSMFSGEVRPFVTGLIPIVGGNAGVAPGPPVNGVTLAMQRGELDLSRLGDPDVDRSSPVGADAPSLVRSTATQGAESLEAIRLRKHQEHERLEMAIQRQLDLVDQAAEAGRLSDARRHLRTALGLETDPARKADLKRRMAWLK